MSRRKGYHHGDLRRALIEAALGLIAVGGPAALTLRATARAAGVTHGAPYRHFADKAALMAAVAEEGFASLEAALAKGMTDAGDDPAEVFAASGQAYVQFAVEHPDHFRVMFSSELADKGAHPDLQRASDSAFATLTEAIIAAQNVGAVREGDILDLALAAWSMCHGFACLVVDGQLANAGISNDDIEPVTRRLQDILRDGMGPAKIGPV